VSAAVLLAIGILVWFQPQKLLIDQWVDEAIPSAAPPAGPEAGGPAASTDRPDPITLAAGQFRSLGHGTTDRAIALDLGGGMRPLRLEGLARRCCI